MEVKFSKIGTNRYKLERGPEMSSEARFYASEEILPLVTQDRSLAQLKETAKLPGIYKDVLGMPDMHQGYGIPVGGIVASERIVSAGCVGMDINCGVRLLKTESEYDDNLYSKENLKLLIELIEDHIPVGLGQGYKSTHKGLEIDKIIKHGVVHLVENGYGNEDDIEYCEEKGQLSDVDVGDLSDKAIGRAEKQIGTLGSGNHFIEVQKVAEIYDHDIAEKFGLSTNQICFMIHSGSRALGHQTCIDYTKRFEKTNRHSRPELVPSKNLASTEIDSKEGKMYLSAMRGSANFAFANRQMMTHKLRTAFGKFASKIDQDYSLELVYDVAHNSAKWEEHDGKRVLVHRKGATRALPSGHKKNPKAYKDTGHPAIVPGSMGSSSYVLVGTDSEDETFFSVNHGAGRKMSRNAAKDKFSNKKEFDRQMGDVVFNKSYRQIADEAPEAYKEIEAVVDVLADISLTKRVVRLEPLAVVKGD